MTRMETQITRQKQNHGASAYLTKIFIGVYQALRKSKSGWHPGSHFMILAVTFMVSRSHFGQVAGIPDQLADFKAT